MAAGLKLVVVFWNAWGIHVTVLVSFTMQVALLLLSDFRRRNGSAWLKWPIWSAYMLTDTTAIYALGHMSVMCSWSPEHYLMALWAPLLLVHLGGQDNITAYAIEDNRLWLRHLQTFVLQVAAAVYVLYASSIVSHPSKLRWAAILMLLVGFLKYGERIWALFHANSCASSSLSRSSYDSKGSGSRTGGGDHQQADCLARAINERNRDLIVAYSLLDGTKKMFEGPTSHVKINRQDKKVFKRLIFKNLYNEKVDEANEAEELDEEEVDDEAQELDKEEAEYMFRVVGMQLSMMYDLLYTKAAVVHTWYGLGSRVFFSLPLTVTALVLFLRSSSMSHGGDSRDAAAAAAAAAGLDYNRADVAVTIVLLTGAVVLEFVSVLRAIFSKWTAVLLYGSSWNTIGDKVFLVESKVTATMKALLGSGSYDWSGSMQQLRFFDVSGRSNISIGSKMARWMGVEDLWDSTVYSYSIEVPDLAITKVLKLLSSTTTNEIMTSWGKNAVGRSLNNSEELITFIWTGDEEMGVEQRILVWHIATLVYYWWYRAICFHELHVFPGQWDEAKVIEALASYMFSLLAARPYMLPYPVNRDGYKKLCSDAVAHMRRRCTPWGLLKAIQKQEKDLVEGTPLRLEETAFSTSMNNTTLDKACQLAAKLIHITDMRGGQTETTFTVKGQDYNKIKVKVVVNMVIEVWAEMLCYTANLCNENYHAKHLMDGGEIMTVISLMMIYMKNGLFRQNASTRRAAGEPTAEGPTSQEDIESGRRI